MRVHTQPSVRELTDQLLGESVAELEPLGSREGLVYILWHAQRQVQQQLARRPPLADLRFFLTRCEYWMEDIDADKLAPQHVAVWQLVQTLHQRWTSRWSPSSYKSSFVPRRAYSVKFSVLLIGIVSCLVMFTSVVPSFGQGPFGTSTNMVPPFSLPSSPFLSPGYETPLMENSKFAANETIEHHVDFIRPQGARPEDDPMPGMVVFTQRNVRQEKDVQPYCHLVTLQHLNRILYEDSRKEPKRRRFKSVADIHRYYSYLGIVEKVNPVDGTQRGLVGVMMKVVVVVQGRVRAINIFEPKEMYGTTEVPRQHGTDLAFLYKMVPINENEWFKQLKGRRLAAEKRDLTSKRKSVPETAVQKRHGGGRALGHGSVRKPKRYFPGTKKVQRGTQEAMQFRRQQHRQQQQTASDSEPSSAPSGNTYSRLSPEEKADARRRMIATLGNIALAREELKEDDRSTLSLAERVIIKKALEYVARDFNLMKGAETEDDIDPSEESEESRDRAAGWGPNPPRDNVFELHRDFVFNRNLAFLIKRLMEHLLRTPGTLDGFEEKDDIEPVIEGVISAIQARRVEKAKLRSAGNTSESSFATPAPRMYRRETDDEQNDPESEEEEEEEEEQKDDYELPPSLAENLKPDMTWQIVPMATKSGLPIDEKLYTSLEDHDFYIGDLRHVGKSSWNHMNVRHHMYADKIHQFVYQREPGQCFELVGKFMQIDIHLRR